MAPTTLEIAKRQEDKGAIWESMKGFVREITNSIKYLRH